jgi:hypothetical protein
MGISYTVGISYAVGIGYTMGVRYTRLLATKYTAIWGNSPTLGINKSYVR